MPLASYDPALEGSELKSQPCWARVSVALEDEEHAKVAAGVLKTSVGIDAFP